MKKVVIRQTSAFSKQLQQLGSEAQFQRVAERLQAHPERGDVIPGTGGLRKIRMALPTTGTRGGARIIYIWLKTANELVFLWVFTKGEAEDLNPKEKKALSEFASQIKSEQDAKRRER